MQDTHHIVSETLNIIEHEYGIEDVHDLGPPTVNEIVERIEAGTVQLSISFSGDASEAFSEHIKDMRGWYVRITPLDGEPFDALIAGSSQPLAVTVDGDTWYDAVTYLDIDSDTGNALPDAKTVRVRNVYVY